MRTVLVALGTCLIAATAWGKDPPRPDRDEPREDKRADQACAYLGQGYTRAPGSETCVRVGGSVRFEGAAQWGR